MRSSRAPDAVPHCPMWSGTRSATLSSRRRGTFPSPLAWMEGVAWCQGGQLFPPSSIVEHDAVRDPVVAERMGVGVGRRARGRRDAAAPQPPRPGRISPSGRGGSTSQFSKGRVAETIFVASTSCCAGKSGAFDNRIPRTQIGNGRVSRLNVFGKRRPAFARKLNWTNTAVTT